LLSWKNRLDVALKLAEQSVSEVGNDLTYFFGQTQIKEVPRGVLNQATLLPSKTTVNGTQTHVQRDTSYESKVYNRQKKNNIGVNFLSKIQSSSLH